MSAPRRPGTVTVVVVLTWISAVLSVLGGLALLILGGAAGGSVTGPAAGFGTTTVMVIGAVYIVIGLLMGAVASRLGQGGRGARLIVTILTVLQIVGAVAALAGAGSTTATSSGWGSILVGLVLLALLWNARANAFFAGERL